MIRKLLIKIKRLISSISNKEQKLCSDCIYLDECYIKITNETLKKVACSRFKTFY